MRQHIIYHSYTDDIVTNQGQNYTLPDDYCWVNRTYPKKLLSGMIYAIAVVFSEIYSRFFLHVKVTGRENIKKRGRSGFYVYGNHTQTIGDAFVPIFLFRGCRMRAIVSTANLGIPVLGKILPYMGALPIPGLNKMREFLSAVDHYSKIGNGIVIYPEAHAWPYYTGIRPFGTATFSYPVKNGFPVYCMTTTYQKRKIGDKPRITVYIDGPFEIDKTQISSKQKKELQKKITRCMSKRSRNSTYAYWDYEERK